MRYALLVCLLCCCTVVLTAQTRISGTVVTTGGQPVEFATVALLDRATGEIADAVTTDLDGNFALETALPDFFLDVSFVGFDTRRIDPVPVTDGRAALGRLELRESATLLDEVVVSAEQSTTEFRLDKRIFNVGKDLSSTGAGAYEVLNNVPSVNVSIEGQISLRGSAGVQILINGKPSVIASQEGSALGTLTADMIERIEVITNPSAKYEAEGTAGIINIVLKKEERRGVNGSVTVNGGAPHNHSLGLSLNRRTEKFNLFSQLGVGYRELPRETENVNIDRTTDLRIDSEGEEFRNEQFYNLILGTDYHINARNVLTLSGSFAYEIEDQPSRTDFVLTDAAGNQQSWTRTETTEALNPKYQYELQYKSDFEGEGHTLLLSALGNLFAKDQSSAFENVGDAPVPDQRTRTDFGETRYTFKADYTKPVNEKITVETGAQYELQDVGNDFSVSNLVDGVLEVQPELTNDFRFDQRVLGLYATGAYEDERWGVKVGLRAENTDLATLLLTTNQANDRNYTNWFPTFHGSYKITDAFSVQGGYSRRIFRPRLWDLNPFFNPRNNFAIRTGNPDLLPEFTDSYELAGIQIFERGSVNFGVYHRYTTDVVERVVRFDDGVSITQPLNVGTNRATGVEINGKLNVNKRLVFNGDLNYNYFQREGTFEALNFDFGADQWSAKLRAKVKLPADVDAEVTGQYRSAEQRVQGRQSANLFADFGLRKKLMGGRGIVNFSVRDVFASRFREFIADQPDFYTYSYGRRGRFVVLGFSYGFGKGEAMEFSGRKRI